MKLHEMKLQRQLRKKKNGGGARELRLAWKAQTSAWKVEKGNYRALSQGCS